jgi:hypothetical protein
MNGADVIGLVFSVINDTILSLIKSGRMFSTIHVARRNAQVRIILVVKIIYLTIQRPKVKWNVILKRTFKKICVGWI